MQVSSGKKTPFQFLLILRFRLGIKNGGQGKRYDLGANIYLTPEIH